MPDPSTDTLRSALAELTEAVVDKLATMDYYFGPNARTATSGESRAAFNRIDAAVEAAREALAAVPEEAPEPGWEWRVVAAWPDFKWQYDSGSLDAMQARLPQYVKEFPDGDVFIERRRKAGEWERVEEPKDLPALSQTDAPGA